MNEVLRSLQRKLTEATEDDSKDIYMTFGRMNPCTKGHLKVLKMLNAHPRNFLYLSHSQDTKKNPLYYEEKIDLVEKVKAYNDLTQLNVVTSKARNMFDAIQEVYNNTPDAKECTLHIVCGVDDKTLVTSTAKYNGHPSDKMKEAGDGYQFKDIVAEFSGRDGNSEFDNVSATAVRKAAVDGNFDRFVALMPPLKQMDLVAVFHTIQDRLPGAEPTPIEKVAESLESEDLFFGNSGYEEPNDDLANLMNEEDKKRYNLVK